MWTEGSVLTVSSFPRTPSGHFPLLRKTHFCCFCQLLVDFPSLCSAYATSLRIPWAYQQQASKAIQEVSKLSKAVNKRLMQYARALQKQQQAQRTEKSKRATTDPSQLSIRQLEPTSPQKTQKPRKPCHDRGSIKANDCDINALPSANRSAVMVPKVRTNRRVVPSG